MLAIHIFTTYVDSYCPMTHDIPIISPLSLFIANLRCPAKKNAG